MTWAYFVKGHIRIFGNFTCNPLTFLKGLLCEGTRRFKARLCWFCTLLYLQQRRNQTKYRELLAQRAQQFRTIQRRLLTRFKDKTPAPLANLDTLLDGTYRQVTKFKKNTGERCFVLQWHRRLGRKSTITPCMIRICGLLGTNIIQMFYHRRLVWA